MTTLAVTGTAVVGAFLGLVIGALLGDRPRSDFNVFMPVIYGLIGATVGALIGTALGAALWT
jgi:uncharacterized membrane protein YeaQ/YmgE (transglycosylase-associated protein family)